MRKTSFEKPIAFFGKSVLGAGAAGAGACTAGALGVAAGEGEGGGPCAAALEPHNNTLPTSPPANFQLMLLTSPIREP
jgi:hypothetical protein